MNKMILHRLSVKVQIKSHRPTNKLIIPVRSLIPLDAHHRSILKHGHMNKTILHQLSAWRSTKIQCYRQANNTSFLEEQSTTSPIHDSPSVVC